MLRSFQVLCLILCLAVLVFFGWAPSADQALGVVFLPFAILFFAIACFIQGEISSGRDPARMLKSLAKYVRGDHKVVDVPRTVGRCGK